MVLGDRRQQRHRQGPEATRLGIYPKSEAVGNAKFGCRDVDKTHQKAKGSLRPSLWRDGSESDSISGTLGSPNEKHFFYHGKAIRHFRKGAGLTQEQLALAIDGHPADISRLESGDANPNFSTIANVADGLGVSVSRIFSLGEAYAERRKKPRE